MANVTITQTELDELRAAKEQVEKQKEAGRVYWQKYKIKWELFTKDAIAAGVKEPSPKRIHEEWLRRKKEGLIK